MTIRGVAVTACLILLLSVWGCATDEVSITESKVDTPTALDQPSSDVAAAAEDTEAEADSPTDEEPAVEEEVAQKVEVPNAVDPPSTVDKASGLSVASKGNVAPDLVGTWVLEMTGFEDMEFPGLTEEDLADLPDDAEAMAGFAEMMSGMMGMFGGMKDTYVLNADGTFVKTTTMGFGGEVGGGESVMEGVWSANDGWISLYIMRISPSLPGHHSMVITFADATVMPPMAMKLAEDRKTFVDGLTASMDVGGMAAAGISVLYRKQPEDD